MPVDNPYVRVYQSIFDDDRFVSIVDDDHHLATWLRLLMHADPVWPLAAPLPATARKASVKALVDVGIVELTGGRYRIHGLDAERERRAAKARASASHRTYDRTANAMRTHSDSNARASVSVSEVTSLVHKEPREDFDALDRYHELTGWRPWGQFSGEKLQAAIRDYGDEVVTSALEAEYAKDGTKDTLLKRTEARLAKDADRRREADRAKREARPAVVPIDEKARNAIIVELMESKGDAS